MHSDSGAHAQSPKHHSIKVVFAAEKLRGGAHVDDAIAKLKITLAGTIASAAVIKSQGIISGFCQRITHAAKHPVRPKFWRRVQVTLKYHYPDAPARFRCGKVHDTVHRPTVPGKRHQFIACHDRLQTQSAIARCARRISQATNCYRPPRKWARR